MTKWQNVKLSDVAYEVSARVDNPSTSGYDRFVGLDNFVSGGFKISNWSGTDNLISAMKLFKAGDTLFARRNAYLKRVSMADFDGICSGDAIVLRNNEKMINGFLPLILNTDHFWNYAIANAAGSMSKRVRVEDLMKYEFPLPPVDEQLRIADMLWAADDVKVAQIEAKNSLGKLRLAIASDFFTSKDGRTTEFGNIPSDWNYLPLENVTISSSYGPRFPATLYDENGKVLSIRTTDFREHGQISYIEAQAANLSDEMIENHKLEDGDFLLSRSGEYAGMVRVFRDPKIEDKTFIPAAFLVRFRLDQKQVMPDYVFELFESLVGKSIIRGLARGSAQPNIAGSTLLKLKIPIPPMHLQESFCKKMKQIRSGEIEFEKNLEVLHILAKQMISSLLDQPH